MTKSRLIHIKLENDEAIQSRRDILTTEADFIKMARLIKEYKALRIIELSLKVELLKKLKEFKLTSQKLKTLLPKVEIPKILKKHEQERREEEEFGVIQKEVIEKPKKLKREKIVKKKEPVDELEKQLEEIQARLRKLE